MKFLLQYILIVLATSSVLCKKEPRVRIAVDKRIIGCTRKSKDGDIVHVHYKGFLENGKLFDSSGDVPYRLILGHNQVIKGWDEGLRHMCVGERRHLWIPPELAYGEKGSGFLIPPNAELFFEVEMVRINSNLEL